MKDSIEIANYLGLAAEVFETQAAAQRGQFDELAARDQLADILMVSAPLSVEGLQFGGFRRHPRQFRGGRVMSINPVNDLFGEVI